VAVEVLIDLGHPGSHLFVLVVLFGMGSLIEVLDLASVIRTSLQGSIQWRMHTVVVTYRVVWIERERGVRVAPIIHH
jgi:hypothetical protein